VLAYLLDNVGRILGSGRPKWRELIDVFCLKYPGVDICYLHLHTRRSHNSLGLYPNYRAYRVPGGFIVWRIGQDGGFIGRFDHYPIAAGTYVLQLYPTWIGAHNEFCKKQTSAATDRAMYARSASNIGTATVMTGCGEFAYNASVGEVSVQPFTSMVLVGDVASNNGTQGNATQARGEDMALRAATAKHVVKCPGCQQSLRIPAGKNLKIRCPTCAEAFQLDLRTNSTH
jgi:hypothetical protein